METSLAGEFAKQRPAALNKQRFCYTFFAAKVMVQATHGAICILKNVSHVCLFYTDIREMRQRDFHYARLQGTCLALTGLAFASLTLVEDRGRGHISVTYV